MTCPACGAGNRPGARFCFECGSALVARCASCNAELPPGARFCDECGTAVAASVAATPVPTAARKVVTVVFADLAGSTTLQESLDPESVRRMMDAFYDALRPAVTAHDGTVVKFTGDGLMAAFGVQAVAEDDAWRALKAAAAMQEAFASLGWDAALSLRVGVNTGEVIVTEGETDVVGDAVNVAARLEAAAGPGGVLVGEETWRLTRNLAAFEPVAPLALKGKAEPVLAYRLISAVAATSEAAGPFVGRDEEIARLAALFDDAVASSTARLATIIGSPGLGKSRLAAELSARLEQGATIVEARFVATAASTFGPLAEAMRTALGDEGLADLLEGSPQQAFLAVRRALEALAADRPVVLVLDDLHWAEPLMLDLVEHLAEWTRNTPVFILALARPEIRELRPALVDIAGRAAAVVVLEGLEPDASARLTCSLLETDELPPALLARVLAGSEGNPLFVRELVRMLVDDGVLRRDADGWRSTIDVDAIAVPPTIQSLLAARIERLAPEERTVLECAAVIGREFYGGAVAELVPTALRATLPMILERLRQKELVEPEGTYWIDEPVLRFHHVLLRDAAYRRLLKEVRADLHERYARWLDAKAEGADEQAEVVGYHFEQAHQYRTDLGVFDERTTALGHAAAEHLARAGRRALDRDDLPVAAGLLGRALARVDGDDPGRAQLLIDRCEALITTGALADGALAVAELEELAAASPRLRAWASCFRSQLATLTDPRHLEESAEAARCAAADLSKLADTAGAAKAHSVHAGALARLGRVAECEAALDRALAAARDAGDTRRATAVLAGAPLAALWGPSPVARASGRCLDVVRVLRITTSATTVEATSLRCQAVLEALRGRFDAARRMLASARRSLEELGHRHGLLSTEMFAGLVELLSEDWPAAEARLREAHSGFVDLGAGADAAQAAALLARAVLAQGRVEEAETLTVESEELGGADLKTAIAWRTARAEALARQDRTEEGLRLAEAAVALAAPTDGLLDQADTHLSLATVLRLARRREEARAEARRATELYERKGASVLADRARSLTEADTSADTGSSEVASTQRGLWPRTNAAGRAHQEFVDLWLARHWEQARAHLAPEIEMVDRRGALATRITDPETYIANLRQIVELGVTGIDTTALATRGDSLHLARLVFYGDTADGDRGEVALLRVSEIDSTGRLRYACTFEPDDTEAAFAHLDERFLATLTPQAAEVWSVALRFANAYNDRAWPDLDATLSLDFVRLDQRPSGLDPLDKAGYQHFMQLLIDDAPHTRIEGVEVPAVTASGFVALSMLEGGGGLVGPSELLRIQVGVVRDGQITHLEYWPAEEIEAAVARLSELTTTVGPTNSATRLSARFFNAFEVAPIATRGDLLGLVRVVGADDAGNDTEFLQVDEYDENHRKIFGASFDVEDADVAANVLDERFGIGALAEVWRIVLRFRDAYRERDWEALNALFHPDFTIIDHRPAGWGTVDAAQFQEIASALVEVSDDARLDIWSVPIATPEGAAFTMTASGTSADGAVFEIARAMTVRFRDGLIERFEMFPPEELDRAVSRVRELEAPDRRGDDAAHAEVLAVLDSFVAAFVERDVDLLRSILHDRYRLVDHRPLGWGAIDKDRFADLVQSLFELTPNFHPHPSALPRLSEQGLVATMSGVGVDGTGNSFEIANCQLFLVEDGLITHHEAFPPDAVETAVARFDELTGTPVVVATIAIRGERLQLSRARRRHEAGDDAEVLLAVEVDHGGRRVWAREFNVDDFPHAIDAVNDRYEASLPAEERAVFGAVRGFSGAVNRRDWDGFASRCSPSFRIVDHRPAGWQARDPAELADLTRALTDMAPDVYLWATDVRLVTPAGMAFIAVNSGTSDEGGQFELRRACTVVVRDGLVDRLEYFGPDDLAAAISRLAELTSDTEARSVSLPDAIPPTTATRSVMRFTSDFLTHEWERLSEIFAEDVTVNDRRAGSRSVILGRAAILENNRQMAAIRERNVSILATRGDRLVLLASTWKGRLPDTGPFEVETLDVAEMNEDGLATRYVVFDPSEVDVAYAELDARFEAGEGAPYARAHRAGRRAYELWGTRDWDGLLNVFTPDGVMVDRRPLGWGEVTPADFVNRLRMLAEMVPNASMRELAVVRLNERASLGLMAGRGRSDDDTEIEIDFYCLIVVDGDQVSRVEFLAAEDPEGAIARFDEVTGSWRSVMPATRAQLAGRRAGEFARRHDADLMATVYSESVVLEDRRRGLGSLVRGRDAIAAVTSGLGAVTEIEPLEVATRGESLSLARVTFRGTSSRGAEFEADTLQVTEVDAEGLVTHQLTLDGDDIGAAFEELDRRFIAGEGAVAAPALNVLRRIQEVYATRDWDGLAALVHPEFEMRDHRPTSGRAVADADMFVATARSLVELAPDASVRFVAVPRFTEAGAVFIEQIVGTTEEAGPFELPFSTLLLVENGLCTRLEHFPVEELPAAIARFDELTRADPLANAASRLGRKIADRILAHDLGGLGALHEPDAVQEDRRPGFRSVIRGREGHVAQARAMGGVSDATVTILATRGDRGALFRAVWSGEDGLGGQFEAESLQVADLSEAGRLARSFLFSPDDLDAAFDELDRCFAEGEAAASPAAWQAVQDVVRSHNTKDKDLFASQARDVATAVDHRRLGWGQLKGRQFERSASMSVEDSMMRCVAVPRVAPNGIVAVLATTGTVPHGGGTWESDFVVVAEVGVGGAWNLEFFAVEDLQRALDRFDEITSDPGHVRPNRAHQTASGTLSCLLAHDYEGLGALFSYDAVLDDRRPGLRSVIAGRSAIVENYRGMWAVDAVTPQLLATRGDRLALSRITWLGRRGDAAFEVELVNLAEIDDSGHVVAMLQFEPADMDAAFRELDKRFLAGEGSRHAAVLEVLREAMASHAANDWDRFIAGVHPDAVIVDHRPLGWGTLDRKAWAERLRSLLEIAPDSSARVLALPRLGPRGCVAVLRQTGTTLDGASFELVGSIVMQVENGVATRQDYYGPDQLDDALARFDELTSAGNLVKPNRAQLAANEGLRRVEAHEYEELGALFSDDAVVDDRRAGIRSVIRGRDAVVPSLRATSGVTETMPRLVATRGDRLALATIVWRGAGDPGDAFEVELLSMTELNADGLITAVLLFDADDRDRAYRELHARFRAGEGAPYAATLDVGAALGDRWSERDWQAVRDLFAPGAAVVDHRHLGWGEVDVAGFIARARMLTDMAPDARLDGVATPRLNERGSVAVIIGEGTTADGTHFEMSWVMLLLLRDDRIARVEMFPLDQLEVAVASFDRSTRDLTAG